jgi:hypothetical protein
MDVKVLATTTVVTLTIHNDGEATISASAPIAFYNGGQTPTPLESSPLIETQMVSVDIFKGETVTIDYTLTGSFNDQLIWARIMDDGNGSKFPATGAEDCDPANNTLSGVDCPYLNVKTTVYPNSNTICGLTGTIRLSVTDMSGGSFAFHNTPTFQWYKDSVSISGAINAVLNVTTAGKYFCFVEDGICSKYTQEETITVNPACVPANISGDDLLCAGGTSQLTALPTGGSWTSLNTSVATVNSTGLVTGVSAGSTTIRYVVANGGGAADSATLAITVHPIPTITLTGGTQNQTVCEGTAIMQTVYTFGGSATGAGVSGLPTGLSQSVNTATKTVTISGTPTTGGTYTITTDNPASCTPATISGTITVNPKSTLTLTSVAGTDNQTTVCTGAAIMPIVYTYGGSATNVSVSGLPAGLSTVVDPVLKTLTISGVPSVNGNYTLTTSGHTAPCAAATANGSVTISASTTVTTPVIVSESGATVICGNTASIMLKLTTNYASTSVIYQWFKDDLPIQGANAIYYNATEAGAYSIEVYVDGCSGQSTKMNITKNGSGATAKPDLKSEGNITALCSGNSSLRLYVNNANAYGTTATYIWYKNGTEILRGAGLSHYIANTTGKYSVYVYETAGCGSLSDTITITQGTGTGITTPIIASELGAAVICGNTASILLKLATEYTGTTVNYQWFKGDTLLTGATSIYYNATEAGNYSIYVNVDGCGAQSIKISVTKENGGTTAKPDLKSEGNVTALCSNTNSLRLYVNNATSYSSTATFVWYKDGAEILRGRGLSNYIVSLAGSYSVYVYETDGCGSLSDTVTVTQNNGTGIATPSIVSESGELIICQNGSGIMLKLNTTYTGTNVTYQWFKGNTLISGANAKNYYATEPGAYSILVTVDGCSSQSAKISVVKQRCR